MKAGIDNAYTNERHCSMETLSTKQAAHPIWSMSQVIVGEGAQKNINLYLL